MLKTAESDDDTMMMSACERPRCACSFLCMAIKGTCLGGRSIANTAQIYLEDGSGCCRSGHGYRTVCLADRTTLGGTGRASPSSGSFARSSGWKALGPDQRPSHWSQGRRSVFDGYARPRAPFATRYLGDHW